MPASCPPQAHQYGADADGGGGMQMGGGHGGDGGAPGFSGGLTEGELLARVQCSAAELRAALRDRRALCLGALHGAAWRRAARAHGGAELHVLH